MNLPTGRKQFAQPCQKILARRPEVFGSFLKKNRTHTYFSKKYFPSNFLVDTYISALAILLEVFWQKTGIFLQINRNVKNYLLFFQKNYIRMFLGTRRKLFLQPESFWLLSKNDVQNFFLWNALLRIYL